MKLPGSCLLSLRVVMELTRSCCGVAWELSLVIRSCHGVDQELSWSCLGVAVVVRSCHGVAWELSLAIRS